MSLTLVPFSKVEVGARFRSNNLEYLKVDKESAVNMNDSDDPIKTYFLDDPLCSTMVDPKTGKKSL